MEQEANIALGYRYRTTWDVDERSDFENQIQQLINDGNKNERLLAFHLIRHTAPATPHARVHSDFHPMIRELHDRFKDFLVNNLPKKEIHRSSSPWQK